MVAIGSSSRRAPSAWQKRASLQFSFLLVLGAMVAYFGVLLSFASSNPISAVNNGQELISIPIPDRRPQDHSLYESLHGSNPKPRSRTRVSRAETPSTNLEGKKPSNGVTSTERGASEAIGESVSTQTGVSRGRNNFRNVVIPSLSGSIRKPGWMGKPHGEGVQPQLLVSVGSKDNTASSRESGQHPDPDHVLKAFVEPIDFKEWEIKPLPVRTTATADQLEEISYPKLNSCKKLPEMIPANEYPDHDAFLPWIHDVFPTDDGKFIQFIAQNRRRCHTGKTDSEKVILHLTQPNIALFQHVPVKRIKLPGRQETRYRLSSHEEADPDGVATRFICRFKPSMEETLSVYNFDYDYASHRKRQRNTFQYNNGGILSVHMSQFIFRCPVPENLVEIVRSGASVKDDWATLFVDVVPIRTPPRYGLSNEFLQPRYYDRLPVNIHDRFDPGLEWGDSHVLPRIEDSGRWENIPICRTSLKEYYQAPDKFEHDANTVSLADTTGNNNAIAKRHRLVACMWASAGYTTRGNRFAVNDGQRRMLEWITFNKLLGFEHFYLYDNSYAFSDEITLEPIANLFPDDITYIKWPFQVCNNNPNNVDSPGERSSQYAAESSCRLRFGPHAHWIGQFDIDEYLIPMGNYTSILPILDKLDNEGKKILSFGSWRSWPRHDYIEDPVPITDPSQCGNQQACFELHVPFNTTVLQTFNCDRQSGPKKDVMPAEKQLYRPDYVLQHFIHYSSVTVLSQLSRSEFEKAGFDWLRTRISPDPHSRFSDEIVEATMLHAKAVARQDTAGWQDICKVGFKKKGALCRIGFPFPYGYDEGRDGEGDEKGWKYNCYLNQKTENVWVPLLAKTLKKQGYLVGNN